MNICVQGFDICNKADNLSSIFVDKIQTFSTLSCHHLASPQLLSSWNNEREGGRQRKTRKQSWLQLVHMPIHAGVRQVNVIIDWRQKFPRLLQTEQKPWTRPSTEHFSQFQKREINLRFSQKLTQL